jgi:hypothetical protein
VKDINETLEIEPGAWKLELHFEGDGANRSLEIFLECIIRRADAPPRVER